MLENLEIDEGAQFSIEIIFDLYDMNMIHNNLTKTDLRSISTRPMHFFPSLTISMVACVLVSHTAKIKEYPFVVSKGRDRVTSHSGL